MTSPGRRAHVKRAKVLRTQMWWHGSLGDDLRLAMVCDGAQTKWAVQQNFRDHGHKQKRLANAIRSTYGRNKS